MTISTGSRATLPRGITLPDLIEALNRPAGVLDAAVAGFAEVRIGHNTWAWAEARGGRLTIGIRLHRTTIAAFHRTSELVEDDVAIPELWHLTIATGGWDTVTTRDRINRVLRPLGLNLYSKRGERRIDGVVVDGQLANRTAYHHLGTGIPVATVLGDGTRVVPPYLPAEQVAHLADVLRVPVASLTAAAPGTGELAEEHDLI